MPSFHDIQLDGWKIVAHMYCTCSEYNIRN